MPQPSNGCCGNCVHSSRSSEPGLPEFVEERC